MSVNIGGMVATVIVQGPDNPHLKTVVNTLRTWHKGEIIISSWPTANPIKLEGVTRVFPTDPGPGPIQNIKRQIIGLRAALESVGDDEVVCKIRDDMLCPVDPTLFYKVEPCSDMFSHKVGITRHGTRDPHRFPWFVGDWLWVGLGKDLKKMATVNADDMEIISQAGEASWAKKLHDMYSKVESPVEFLKDNYTILNACDDLKIENLKFPGKSDNHPYI